MKRWWLLGAVGSTTCPVINGIAQPWTSAANGMPRGEWRQPDSSHAGDANPPPPIEHQGQQEYYPPPSSQQQQYDYSQQYDTSQQGQYGSTGQYGDGQPDPYQGYQEDPSSYYAQAPPPYNSPWAMPPNQQYPQQQQYQDGTEGDGSAQGGPNFMNFVNKMKDKVKYKLQAVVQAAPDYQYPGYEGEVGSSGQAYASPDGFPLGGEQGYFPQPAPGSFGYDPTAAVGGAWSQGSDYGGQQYPQQGGAEEYTYPEGYAEYQPQYGEGGEPMYQPTFTEQVEQPPEIQVEDTPPLYTSQPQPEEQAAATPESDVSLPSYGSGWAQPEEQNLDTKPETGEVDKIDYPSEYSFDFFSDSYQPMEKERPVESYSFDAAPVDIVEPWQQQASSKEEVDSFLHTPLPPTPDSPPSNESIDYRHTVEHTPEPPASAVPPSPSPASPENLHSFSEPPASEPASIVSGVVDAAASGIEALGDLASSVMKDNPDISDSIVDSAWVRPKRVEREEEEDLDSQLKAELIAELEQENVESDSTESETEETVSVAPSHSLIPEEKEDEVYDRSTQVGSSIEPLEHKEALDVSEGAFDLQSILDFVGRDPTEVLAELQAEFDSFDDEIEKDPHAGVSVVNGKLEGEKWKLERHAQEAQRQLEQQQVEHHKQQQLREERRRREDDVNRQNAHAEWERVQIEKKLKEQKQRVDQELMREELERTTLQAQIDRQAYDRTLQQIQRDKEELDRKLAIEAQEMQAKKMLLQQKKDEVNRQLQQEELALREQEERLQQHRIQRQQREREQFAQEEREREDAERRRASIRADTLRNEYDFDPRDSEVIQSPVYQQGTSQQAFEEVNESTRAWTRSVEVPHQAQGSGWGSDEDTSDLEPQPPLHTHTHTPTYHTTSHDETIPIVSEWTGISHTDSSPQREDNIRLSQPTTYDGSDTPSVSDSGWGMAEENEEPLEPLNLPPSAAHGETWNDADLKDQLDFYWKQVKLSATERPPHHHHQQVSLYGNTAGGGQSWFGQHTYPDTSGSIYTQGSSAGMLEQRQQDGYEKGDAPEVGALMSLLKRGEGAGAGQQQNVNIYGNVNIYTSGAPPATAEQPHTHKAESYPYRDKY